MLKCRNRTKSNSFDSYGSSSVWARFFPFLRYTCLQLRKCLPCKAWLPGRRPPPGPPWSFPYQAARKTAYKLRFHRGLFSKAPFFPYPVPEAYTAAQLLEVSDRLFLQNQILPDGRMKVYWASPVFCVILKITNSAGLTGATPITQISRPLSMSS